MKLDTKLVKILKLDGVEASKANIASGKYSLYRPFFLYTKGAPSGDAKTFVDFALSAEGQDVISKAGTVNLKEGSSLKLVK